MSTITAITTITANPSSSPTDTSTTSISPSIQSLLPKCEGPPYNGQPVIPGIDEIPKDINVAMIGGSDIAFPAMVNCCWPNHVQLYDGCYLWCKIPQPREGEVDNLGQPKKKLTGDDIYSNFTHCLRSDKSWNNTINQSIQGNIPNKSAASRMVTTAKLGGLVMGLLVVTGLILL